MGVSQDAGKLILRLTVGALLLFHGIHKLVTPAVLTGIKAMVVAHNLPAALAYGVYIGEVVGPILIILGLVSRLGALAIVVNMIFAIWLAGMGSILSLNDSGGYALELECFYLFGALAILFLGAGRYALGGYSRGFN